MEVRIFDKEKDWETVRDWWIQWGKDPIAPILLPSVGLIVGDGEKDVCTTWIYHEPGCGTAVLGFTISNKEIDRNVRSEALDLLYKEVVDLTRKAGILVLTSYNNNKSILKRLSKLGFVKGDLSMTNLIKIL